MKSAGLTDVLCKLLCKHFEISRSVQDF